MEIKFCIVLSKIRRFKYKNETFKVLRGPKKKIKLLASRVQHYLMLLKLLACSNKKMFKQNFECFHTKHNFSYTLLYAAASYTCGYTFIDDRILHLNTLAAVNAYFRYKCRCIVTCTLVYVCFYIRVYVCIC